MALRIGFGTDLHRLVAGDGIWLGGVKVPANKKAEAHSDGDVVLHAVTDALLGAAGRGDIGEMFPASAVEKGQASSLFVESVMSLLKAQGMRVVNADVTIDLEKPRLSEWKQPIRDNIAKYLSADPRRINVKAKTSESIGPVGEGKAVSAQVAIFLEIIE